MAEGDGFEGSGLGVQHYHLGQVSSLGEGDVEAALFVRHFCLRVSMAVEIGHKIAATGHKFLHGRKHLLPVVTLVSVVGKFGEQRGVSHDNDRIVGVKGLVFQPNQLGGAEVEGGGIALGENAVGGVQKNDTNTVLGEIQIVVAYLPRQLHCFTVVGDEGAHKIFVVLLFGDQILFIAEKLTPDMVGVVVPNGHHDGAGRISEISAGELLGGGPHFLGGVDHWILIATGEIPQIGKKFQGNKVGKCLHGVADPLGGKLRKVGIRLNGKGKAVTTGLFHRGDSLLPAVIEIA